MNLWMSAAVPSTVHQDLLSHDLLPELFYGINEEKIQWVEEEDWDYRTIFIVTKERMHWDDAELIFEGLDTYADVYLNGALILNITSHEIKKGRELPLRVKHIRETYN